MKRNVILLVLLNILIFAYFQLAGLTASGDHDALPALHPEQIKLLTDKELQALPSVIPAQEIQSDATLEAAHCLEWGSFNAENLKKAQDVLAQLGLQAQLTEKPSQETKRFWIYIHPAASQAIAEKKVEVLRQHGVEQTFIVQEPKWRYAISLGIFQDEKLADSLLQDLKNKGIKTALKGVRNQDAGQFFLGLNNVPVYKVEAINKVKLEFNDAEIKEVTCH